MSLYTEEKEGEKWITISHQHVKIDGDGNIIAGLGGKFNGKSVQHAIDHLTSQNKPSKPKAASKEKVDKPKSKMQHAHDIIKNAAPNALAKDIKKHLADKLGLSPAAASTYYHNIKKKLAPKEDDKEPDKKVEKEKPTEKEDPIPAGEKSSFSNNAEIAKKFIKDLKDLHGANYDKSKAIAGISDKLAVSKAYATGLHDSLVTSMDKAANAEKKTYKDVVDKVEGSGSKAKQAEQIFKQMSGDSPKAVKDAFVNKIGMSQATASTYYFNLKKKFGSSSEVDQLVKAGVTKQDAEKIVQDAKKAGAKFKEDSKKSTLDHAMDLISSMKKGPNNTAGDIIDAVSKKFNLPEKDAINLAVKANNILLDKEAEEFKKKNADPKPSITSDSLHDILSNNASAGKEAVIKKIKDTFGLKINSDAVAHFDNVHSAWVEKKAKNEIPIIAKNYLKKNAAEPLEYIKKAYMVDDEQAKHVMALYNNVLGDIISGSSKLSVSGLKNKIQSKHPSLGDTPATDLADVIKKYYNGQVSWDDVGHVFWNIHDKKTLSGHKDYEMSQNEMELAALDIVKKMHKTHSPVDIHAEIAETLGLDYDKAYTLMKKAEKVVDKKPITYEDMKDKINSSTGGVKVYHSHGEESSTPIPEHVEKYRSRVELAKKTNAHMALDPHTHLLKVHSEEYAKASDAKKSLAKAVYNYTGSDYHSVNGYLRKTSGADSWTKEVVDTLDKVFKHPSARINKETVVYRGYTSAVVNKLEPGDIFEDKGYMSTTSEEYKAESWSHSGGAVMHILLPKGTNAISARPYSQYSNEHEVLINRGAKIRIIEKIITKGDYEDQITFRAEYVVDKKKNSV